MGEDRSLLDSMAPQAGLRLLPDFPSRLSRVEQGWVGQGAAAHVSCSSSSFHYEGMRAYGLTEWFANPPPWKDWFFCNTGKSQNTWDLKPQSASQGW